MNETEFSRREFTQTSLAGLMSWSLLDLLVQGEAFANEVQPEVVKWVSDVNVLAADVKGQRLSQVDWQKQVEHLFSKVAPEDLFRFFVNT